MSGGKARAGQRGHERKGSGYTNYSAYLLCAKSFFFKLIFCISSIFYFNKTSFKILLLSTEVFFQHDVRIVLFLMTILSYERKSLHTYILEVVVLVSQDIIGVNAHSSCSPMK